VFVSGAALTKEAIVVVTHQDHISELDPGLIMDDVFIVSCSRVVVGVGVFRGI
jgi:hypothetical protein